MYSIPRTIGFALFAAVLASPAIGGVVFLDESFDYDRGTYFSEGFPSI